MNRRRWVMTRALPGVWSGVWGFGGFGLESNNSNSSYRR